MFRISDHEFVVTGDESIGGVRPHHDAIERHARERVGRHENDAVGVADPKDLGIASLDQPRVNSELH